MSKYDIRPQFECLNRILNVSSTIFGRSSNVKIGLLMTQYDIQPKFECQNRIMNIKIRYSAQLRMSK